MRTRQVRAELVSTRNHLVEGGDGTRRKAYQVCACLQSGGHVTLEVVTPAGIKTRGPFKATERVRVLK